MILEWCGNSYVVLRLSDGKTIAIDPHDGGSLGLPKCRREADYILVTHNHFDHNAIEVAMARRTRVVRWRTGEFNLEGDVKVQGYRYYHDKAGGSLRGDVVAYKIVTENMTLGHLSDIGHIPPEEALSPFKDIDVLMVPVGGVTTVDAHEAWKLIEMLKPKLVIPLHFWMPGMTVPYDPLDRFLSISRARRLRVEEGRLEVNKDLLPEKTTIVVFERTATGARTLV
jgi:L-ascorbate metabolism protein UlaG (beta-lactamase superfamily)